MEASSDHVTPYDRFALSDRQVEPLLLSGEHDRELIAFFGLNEYQELRQLAARAHERPLDDKAQRVLIVPGIMGSQLGMQRQAPLPDDILWLDPVDIGNGRLLSLRLPVDTEAAPSKVVAMGPVLHSYLRLKLRLREAGFAPELHHYDWRLSIDASAHALAAKLNQQTSGQTLIVAHSMGGLVARAALPLLNDTPTRVVMLGSPQPGSFAVVQALRGTYAVVRKVARLDHRNGAEQLASQVFSTFPSLYQMLPSPDQSAGLNLFDPLAWPSQGPQPNPVLLQRASGFQKTLVAPDDRVALIVGVDQETVTGLEVVGSEFRYTITRHGDGTVPVTCAHLHGARSYFTNTAHSDLTRDPLVANVVIDLLRDGQTSQLMTRWATQSRAEAKITDAELRLTHTGKVDWSSLEPDARREYLQNLNEPPRLQLRIPA